MPVASAAPQHAQNGSPQEIPLEVHDLLEE